MKSAALGTPASIPTGPQRAPRGRQRTRKSCGAEAKKHFGGDLAGKLVVSGGLGGMGGAQPLAATMNNATFLGADVDRARIQKRLDTRYCDVLVEDLDRAIDQALEWKSKKVAKS